MKFPYRFLLLMLLLVACNATAPGNETPPTSTVQTPVATLTSPPLITPLPASPTPEFPPTNTLPPVDLAIESQHFFLYPAPEIYTGDQVTFQVFPFVPEQLNPADVEVQIRVDGQIVMDSHLTGRNLNGDAVGVYEWVWDTTGLTGEHQINVELDPRDRLIQGDEDAANNELIRIITIDLAVAVSS